ncbi:hypothetical protein F4779DRAFT_595866 [Xylariaceae sp. FL0662B]|nr:hypothetical protein F4779DRAFT_595866 [Xylariaceae sp. FL0662B]
MLADPSISVLGPDPAHRNCVLNGNAFQQDAMQSSNGWQYTCFYASLRSADEPLYIHLSRRKLPEGPWETLVFDDYPQTIDDGHNTVQLGICPGDGTIHLSYDHHCDRIRYRHSQAGVAQTPEAFEWKPSLFTPTLFYLPRLSGQDELFGYITYPRFVQMGTNLLFSFRTGKAGLGDDHLCVYAPGPADNGYVYTFLGTNLKGVNNNPYIHGLDYRNALLYTTWVYRAFVWYPGWDDPQDTKHKAQAGPNSGANNHDICFAYSDDGGRTWRNGAGAAIADLSRGESVVPSSPGITAFAIPAGSGLANQEAQAVDRAGGVHVLNRDCCIGDEKSGGVGGRGREGVRWKHYYRSPDGTWTQRALPHVKAGKRGRLAVGRDDDLYFILPDASASVLTILRAARETAYAVYELVWQGDGFPPTEPLVDTTRLDDDGVLSVFTRAYAAESRKVDVVVLDFKV